MNKLLLAGGLTAGMIIGAAFLNSTDTQAATIADNVYIGSVDVSGMNRTQAQDAISAYAAESGSRMLTLTTGEKSVTVKASELGFSADAGDSVDAALNYGHKGNLIERYQENRSIESGKKKELSLATSIDTEKTKKFLENNESALVNEPVDATLRRDNGTFTYVKGKNGHRLRIDESVSAIAESAAQGTDTDTIKLVTTIKKPRGTKKELSQIRDTLGTYTTDYSSSSAARKQNVANGASKINGTTLYPGETFSVAKTLNPMTAENGYEQAPSYENGTTVLTYGGGICQVSTTLYNAVIRAELSVKKRFAHSMMVHYVQPSQDAAIAGDIKDFVFENNLDTPVYIEGITNGSTITFTIYGKETRDPSRTVDFESETTETIDYKTTIKADPSLPVGTVTRTGDTPHNGLKARLIKIVKENGEEVSRTPFNSSTYRAVNAQYVVGTKSEVKEASDAMKSAIASGDIKTVEAAAAQWKNAKPEEPEDEEKEEEKDDKQRTDTKKDDSKKNESEKDNKAESGKNSGKDSEKVSTEATDSKKE